MKTSYDSGAACLSAYNQDRSNSLQYINFNDVQDNRNSLIEVDQLSPENMENDSDQECTPSFKRTLPSL